MKLFSGTAHPSLSRDVAAILRTKLAKVEVIRFGNSETKVTIQEDVKNEICFVIQPTSNPTDTNLVELFFFCDALKRSGAKKIVGIIPWFGYAKQNIQHRKGECVSVNVVIEFLEKVGFHKVFTFDLHDEASAGIFTIPFENLSAFPLLGKEVLAYFKKNKIDSKNVAIVSPDQGAVEKIRIFGESFFGHTNFPEVVIEKERDQNIPHKAKALDLYGDVKGKIALIVDDMVVSGSTIEPAVELCLKKGATKVYVAAVHHDFTKEAPARLQKTKLEKFFVTNTVKLRPEDKFLKLVEISVAPLIAQTIKSEK